AARPHPPIFIIGHWRTGTTMMHELMIQDRRFTSPTTLQVMSPHHFLATSWATRPLMRLVLPKQRPMDAMELGVDSPQEDEFALCNLGLDSMYLLWAWPNNGALSRLLDLDASGEQHRRRWMATLDRFLKHLTAGDRRRVVFKSPTHTAHLKTLYEMYPDALFVNIVRDPIDVIPSTLRTFQRLQFMQGLQLPRFENLEETVFSQFQQMHELLERDRRNIPESQLVDVHYERLVASPVETIAAVYEHLGIDGFDRVRPLVEQYAEAKKNYVRNRHDPPHELSRMIESRCRDYMERHGYVAQPVATP
ncbi:MAG: sulfotransferase, partial [Planctomycetota bacterium]